MVERAIVTDFGGLADHHAHPVVDEDPPADGGAGVDLDAREEPAEMRHQPREPLEAQAPEPMGEPVELEGVEARITSDHFPHRPCSGVAFENALNILANSAEHGSWLSRILDRF
jgi:hypothetical protein